MSSTKRTTRNAAAGERRFAITLRVRLLAGLMVLSAAGLLVAAFTTHTFLSSFMLQRFDADQARAAPFVDVVMNGFVDPNGGRPGFRADRGPDRLLAAGSFIAAIGSDGTVIREVSYNPQVGSQASSWTTPPAAATPRLPSDVLSRTKPFTVTDKSGNRYRVVVNVDPRQSLGSGVRYVFAMPLHEVDQTLDRLWLVEGAVAAAVLAGVGLVAWFVVGLGLRPLRAMESSAGAIAAGDLSRRIEHPDPRTEVGRLGLALNTMLARIEEAFAARAASEERLRRFLADASHELRTPLTSIRGYAELFRRGANRRPHDLENAMRRIEDEAARMGVLVDELLLLARLDQGRQPAREPVLLAELVADGCDDLRTADPSRTVLLEADADVVVSGDQIQLRQMIGNLLANARVHTPAGTPVEVRLATEGDREPFAVLEVTDHGHGLPAEDLPHVFDRFYRADQARTRDHGGSGLGLAIVAAVVHAHGGRVGVLNLPTAGARFRVELPIHANSQAFPSDEPALSQAAPRSSGQ